MTNSIYIFHRLLYKWTKHGKSPSITKDPGHHTKLLHHTKNSKLIDLVIRIELTSNFNATILKFS